MADAPSTQGSTPKRTFPEPHAGRVRDRKAAWKTFVPEGVKVGAVVEGRKKKAPAKDDKPRVSKWVIALFAFLLVGGAIVGVLMRSMEETKLLKAARAGQ